MELGASITVVLASQIAVPVRSAEPVHDSKLTDLSCLHQVSTTQCITGATIAVGLCNGDVKALNWRMVRSSIIPVLISCPD